MATVTKPMALDESIHTTDGNDTNIADLMQSGLASIATAIGAIPALDAANITYDNSTSGLSATYVGTAIDELASEKADSATTLAGYGITDAYTQTETDNLLSAKQDTLTAGTGIDITSNTISVDATASEITFDDTNAGLGVSNTQDAIDTLSDDLADSQNVLGAKNLIPYPYYESTETDRGITYTNNEDGTVTISAGTPETGTNHVLVSHLSYYQPLEKDTQYILSCGYGGDEALLRLQFYSNGSVVATFPTSSGVVTVDTTGYTFDALQIQIFVTSTLSSDITFYPMLRLASVKDPTYAPYAMTNKDLTDVVKCNQTTAGTYTLQATVNSSGNVTYSWV